jgi:hypothetical protein
VYRVDVGVLLVGAVPEGMLLFDAVPGARGVAVAFDSGYGAEDDSRLAVGSDDAVEFG